MTEKILLDTSVNFLLLQELVRLYSEQTDYGRSTVSEIKGKYCYLGDEPPNLENAMVAFQDFLGRDLTMAEVDQILFDNQSSLSDFDKS
jgi:hypothetical protein